MRRDKLALYVHLVWATWDRLPNITAEIERRLHRNIESLAQEMGCTVLAINGMPEHVHLLVKLPPTVSIARLVKQVKGVSSHFVNQTLQPGFLFRWQGRYGAFSVSRWDVDRIAGYVRRQKEHHGVAAGLLPELEETDEEATVREQA